MAKKQIDTIGIRFDATEAINDAAKLQESLKAMGDSYKYVCDQLKDVSKLSHETIAALNEEKASLEKSMASVGKLVDNAITQLRNIDDILSDLSGAKFNELTRARNAQALRLKRISPDMEGYDEELEMLRRVNREIELRNKSFREMSEKEREALKANRELIVANAERFSITEIKKAIEFTKELRDLERTDSEDYQRYKQEAEGLQRIIDATKELSEAEKARIENERKSTLRDVDTASLDRLKEALKLTEQLRDASDRDTADYDNYKHEAEQLQAAIEKTKELSAIEQERIAKQRQAIVADPMSHSIEQIKEAIKATQELRDAQAPNSALYEAYNNEAASLQRIIDATKELSAAEKARLESERQAAVADPYSKSVEQLKEALKLTEQLRDQQGVGSADYDNYKQQAEQLQKVLEATKEVSAAEQARLEQQRQAIVADPMSHSIEQIKEAIKATQELRDAQAPNSALYEAYNNEAASLQRIIDATKELSAAEKARLEGERKNTLLNIDTASVDKLKEALKLTEQLRDASERDTADYDNYKHEAELLSSAIEKTKELSAAEQARLEQQRQAIVADPMSHSIEQIKEAIKATQELRDAQAPNSALYEAYNNEAASLQRIIDATKELSAAEKARLEGERQAAVADPYSKSVEQLREALKLTEQLRDQQGVGSADYDNYKQQAEQLQKVLEATKEVSAAEKARLEQQRQAIVADPMSHSIEQIKEAIKATQELRDAQAPNSALYEAYNNEAASLQRIIDATKELSAAEKARLEGERKNTLLNIDNASVDRLKEALKLTEQLRDASERDTADYDNYKHEAEQLQAAIEKTKELSAVEQQRLEAQRQAVIADPNKATAEQLKKAIKATEELRDATKEVGSKEYRDLGDQIKKMQKSLKYAGDEAFKLDDVLSDLKHQPIEKLERAAKELEEELRKIPQNTEAYIRESAKLRKVNAQIKEGTDAWDEHENKIMSTIRRLRNYVLVYGGFDAITAKMKELYNGWLELSDSLADVQKTTGLAHKQLALLSRDIDSIDTRSSQEEMHKLAAEAGQMGMKSREDVLGFVKSANELNVALNELGSDGVKDLAKIATLTGDIKRMGVDGALTAIGSSINELSANSQATAGPIVELMRRLGSVAPIANLATSDLAALAATADALGLHVEASGTALSKFITAATTKVEDISFAVNIDPDSLQSLFDTGQAMEALTLILEKVGDMGEEGGAALNEVFKEFGSEGEKMANTIRALAGNTDMLRKNTEISTNAFREATSVTDEYNVKNENAAAIAERIGNVWREFFVNADMTSGVTSLLNKLLDLSKTLLATSNEGAKLRGVIVSLLTLIAASPKRMASFVLSFKDFPALFMGAVRGVKAFTVAWKSMDAAMKANWIGLALSALTSIITGLLTVWQGWGKETERLTATINELKAQEEGEITRLREIYQHTIDVNNSTEDRAAAIKELNTVYGDSLGFMLSEKASVDELTAAYKLLNAEMHLRYAKMVETEYMKKALDTYNSEAKALNDKLTKKVEDDATRLGIFSGDIVNAVNKVAQDFAASGKKLSSGTMEVLEFQEALSQMPEMAGANRDNLNRIVQDHMGAINKIISNEKTLLAAQKNAAEQGTTAVTTAERLVAAERENLLNTQKAELKALLETPAEQISKMTEDELRAHYERILDYGETMKAEVDRQFEDFKVKFPKLDNESQNDYNKRLENEMAKIKASVMEGFTEPLEAVKKEYQGDAWGKVYNIRGWKNLIEDQKKLSTASVKNLVDTYKELKEATQKYTDANALGNIFGKDFKNIQEAQKFIFQLSEKVRLTLESQGRNTEGGFLKKKSGEGSMESELRKDLEAAKSALEAYYKEQERIINDAYMAGEITDKERLRRLSANQQEMSRSFVDLYNVILGETKKYNTDFNKILPGKDLGKLSEQMTKWGAAMVDGMKNSRAENETKIQEEAIRLRQVVEKAMLEGDVFGKLERDFRETLDELSLLARNFGDSFDAVDASMADGLVKELMKLSDKAYEVNEDGLKDLALQNTEYAEWWNQVEGEQLTLLLEKLRGYYDDRLDVQRKYIQKAQREWKQQYKQSGGEAEYEQSKQSTETEYEQGKQSAERKYAQGKQVIAAEQGRQSAMSTLGSIKSAGDYNAERGVIMAEAGLEVEKITETSRLELEKISSTADRETQKIDSYIASLEENLKARALAINAELASIIEAERLVLAGLDPNSEEYAAQANLIAGFEATAEERLAGDAEYVALSGEIDTQVASRKSIETQATLDANAIIMQSDLDTNAIIQQSAQETTESILEQWSQRAEALSGWAEMVGDTMGEVWMLERKANKARAQGDEETAKKLEAQAKESRQNLVKEALNKAIDMAKVWAMELGFKVMYNALAKKSDQDVAVSGAKNTLLSSLADIIANGFKGAGKEVGSKGIAGLATGAIIIAAAAGLAALAKSAVNNMFPEATEGVSDAEASSPKRKLTTGMLTYAEGKYPVLGNDGVVYDAEYAGSNMKTGVYRKPHFGIFAEKQPEMVIDGKTTQRLVLNYPEVYSGILELSRTGRMGMRTYATGNVLEIGEGYDAQAHQAQQQMQMEEMRQTMAATAAALAALTLRLDQPINASVNYFGKGGQREADQRGSRWAARNRVK